MSSAADQGSRSHRKRTKDRNGDVNGGDDGCRDAFPRKSARVSPESSPCNADGSATATAAAAATESRKNGKLKHAKRRSKGVAIDSSKQRDEETFKAFENNLSTYVQKKTTSLSTRSTEKSTATEKEPITTQAVASNVNYSPKARREKFQMGLDSEPVYQVLIREDDSSSSFIRRSTGGGGGGGGGAGNNASSAQRRETSPSPASRINYEEAKSAEARERRRESEKDGRFVSMVNVESQLVKTAKRDYARGEQVTALEYLTEVGPSRYCDDITQNPSTNPNYDDPGKTGDCIFQAAPSNRIRRSNNGCNQRNAEGRNDIEEDVEDGVDEGVEYEGNEEGGAAHVENYTSVASEARARFTEKVMRDWIGEDFMRDMSASVMMAHLGDFARCEKALENVADNKNDSYSTSNKSLPTIEARVIAEYLREPVAWERPCLAGQNCTSVALYEHLRKNAPLFPTATSAASAANNNNSNNNNNTGDGRANGNEISGGGIDDRLDDWDSPNFAARCAKKHVESKGFILREFWLPEHRDVFEEKVNMGLTCEQALRYVKPRFCILCYRFFVSWIAARIAAGLASPPKNPIHDHKNYFEIRGEYSRDSMVPSYGKFNGIVGEIVGFKTSDYVVANVTVTYAVPEEENSSPIERKGRTYNGDSASVDTYNNEGDDVVDGAAAIDGEKNVGDDENVYDDDDGVNVNDTEHQEYEEEFGMDVENSNRIRRRRVRRGENLPERVEEKIGRPATRTKKVRAWIEKSLCTSRERHETGVKR